MSELGREAIVRAVRAAVEPLPWAIALWEGGSAAWGRADEWSDVDLQLLVEDDRVAQAIERVEAALSALSPIELRYPAPEPTWHGHAQVFYRLRDAGEFRLVDLAVMRRTSRNQLAERERHGERAIVFDRTGEAAPTALDRERHGARIAERVEQLRVAFPLFQSLAKKELLRGNPIGALAFYHSHTLQPLVTLLRVRHCPERFDFGPRYAQLDLPADVVRALEPLWFVADAGELAPRLRTAEAWFHAVLGELTAAPGAGTEPDAKEDLSGELRRLFASYAAAFDAFDPDAVAGFYRVPCLMVATDSVASLPSREALVANMRSLVELYRNAGYRSARPALERSALLSPALALATVRWRVERRDAQPAWDFRNTYNLVRTDGAWRIAVSTAHEPWRD